MATPTQILFETYLDAVASKKDSKKFNALRLLKWCEDPLAVKRTEDTTTHDINKWIERSLSEPSERTGKPITGVAVNRELNLMSGAFQYAVKSLPWITVNPVYGAARPEKGKARKRPCCPETRSRRSRCRPATLRTVG